MKYADIKQFFGKRVAVQFASPLIISDYATDVVLSSERIPVIGAIMRTQKTPQGGEITIFEPVPYLPNVELMEIEGGASSGVIVAYVTEKGTKMQLAIDCDHIATVSQMIERPNNVGIKSPIIGA